MALEAIAQLEKLVDQLLIERSELQDRNRSLTTECDGLVQDRLRVIAELDKLLGKLDALEGKTK